MAKLVEFDESTWKIFSVNLGPEDYAFFMENKRQFKDMWDNQGKDFWRCFLGCFRRFSAICGDYKVPELTLCLDYVALVTDIFEYVKDKFIESNFGAARQFIIHSATISQYQPLLQYKDTKSDRTRNPFYKKESREAYREVFGQPESNLSFIKACLLSGILIKFSGAVVGCFRKWLKRPVISYKDLSIWVEALKNRILQYTDDYQGFSPCGWPIKPAPSVDEVPEPDWEKASNLLEASVNKMVDEKFKDKVLEIVKPSEPKKTKKKKIKRKDLDAVSESTVIQNEAVGTLKQAEAWSGTDSYPLAPTDEQIIMNDDLAERYKGIIAGMQARSKPSQENIEEDMVYCRTVDPAIKSPMNILLKWRIWQQMIEGGGRLEFIMPDHRKEEEVLHNNLKWFFDEFTVKPAQCLLNVYEHKRLKEVFSQKDVRISPRVLMELVQLPVPEVKSLSAGIRLEQLQSDVALPSSEHVRAAAQQQVVLRRPDQLERFTQRYNSSKVTTYHSRDETGKGKTVCGHPFHDMLGKFDSMTLQELHDDSFKEMEVLAKLSALKLVCSATETMGDPDSEAERVMCEVFLKKQWNTCTSTVAVVLQSVFESQLMEKLCLLPVGTKCELCAGWVKRNSPDVLPQTKMIESNEFADKSVVELVSLARDPSYTTYQYMQHVWGVVTKDARQLMQNQSSRLQSLIQQRKLVKRLPLSSETYRTQTQELEKTTSEMQGAWLSICARAKRLSDLSDSNKTQTVDDLNRTESLKGGLRSALKKTGFGKEIQNMTVMTYWHEHVMKKVASQRMSKDGKHSIIPIGQDGMLELTNSLEDKTSVFQTSFSGVVKLPSALCKGFSVINFEVTPFTAEEAIEDEELSQDIVDMREPLVKRMFGKRTPPTWDLHSFWPEPPSDADEQTKLRNGRGVFDRAQVCIWYIRHMGLMLITIITNTEEILPLLEEEMGKVRDRLLEAAVEMGHKQLDRLEQEKPTEKPRKKSKQPKVNVLRKILRDTKDDPVLSSMFAVRDAINDRKTLSIEHISTILNQDVIDIRPIALKKPHWRCIKKIELTYKDSAGQVCPLWKYEAKPQTEMIELNEAGKLRPAERIWSLAIHSDVKPTGFQNYVERSDRVRAVCNFQSKPEERATVEARPSSMDKSTQVTMSSSAADKKATGVKSKSNVSNDTSTNGKQTRKKSKEVKDKSEKPKTSTPEESKEPSSEAKTTVDEKLRDTEATSSPLEAAAAHVNGVDSKPRTRRPKQCAQCGKVEVERRQFGKCGKCSKEGIKNAPYYCGKDCQTLDWKTKHYKEHTTTEE